MLSAEHYYVYKRPDGYPCVDTVEWNPDAMDGYELISVEDKDPGLRGNETLVDGKWVAPPIPYEELRRRAYPPIGDQLDALWHSMDRGEAYKVAEFYHPIKKIKDSIPK